MNEVHPVKTKITAQMALVAYNYAKKVYADEMRLTDAKIEVSRIIGMNPGSVQDYIMDFKAMMAGEVYSRTMKNADSKLFITSIYKDFGEKYFIRAIEATKKHIEYYEDKSGTNLSGKRQMLLELENKNENDDNLEILNQDNDLSIAEVEKLRVGKIENVHLRRIIETEHISKELLLMLQDEVYSKKNFDIQFPLLVREGSSFDPIRYYKKPLTVRGGIYYLSSQWYETSANNDKKYLLDWMKKYLE